MQTDTNSDDLLRYAMRQCTTDEIRGIITFATTTLEFAVADKTAPRSTPRLRGREAIQHAILIAGADELKLRDRLAQDLLAGAQFGGIPGAVGRDDS